MLEVEIKASLQGLSAAALRERAVSLGFQPAQRLRESDTYFNGSSRDLRDTDEALRLRRVCPLPRGRQESLLTYKGPKLDPLSNTRTEYETAVADGAAAERILLSLGYRPLFTVEKLRQTFRLGEVTLCLDEVAGLGAYLELETLTGGEPQRPEALERLLELLDRLGVPRERLTRHSYLELVQSAAAGPQGQALSNSAVSGILGKNTSDESGG